MIFGPKLETSSRFVFGQNGPRITSHDHLVRKRAFLDYKNKDYA